MKKKKYITPMCEVMEMETKNTLLSMSQGTVGGAETGQTPDEYKPENPGDIWEID